LAAELAEFELDFVPRHAVKSQVLADFIVDWIPSASPLGARMTVSQSPELRSSLKPTGLFSSTAPLISRGRAGVVLLAPHGDQIKYIVHLDFKATNNMAEYKAMLFGLSTTLSLGSGISS
jgi:hypothetical protein